MTGMINTGDNNISGYGSRTVAIEVTGVCRQELTRTSNYTVKVPYSRMSQTIQNINRLGGKVANISLNKTTLVASTEDPEQEVPKRSNG
ncbi:MAG TPA: phycobilisome linker polypeptide [Coleofasciculaceae cyanobacterium]|jgi:hypothetical protein